MKSKMKAIAPILILFNCILSTSAISGGSEVEADRCTRWLDAFIVRDFHKAAMIAVEQLKTADVPDIYIQKQRSELASLYDRITNLGAGEPKLTRKLPDHVIVETNDIVKLQIWNFGKGSAYVGCVSYPGTDSPWHLVVKFDDNVENLIGKLDKADISHIASP